jgi:glycosyltransferase involved in cell wall biosynthesis
MTVPGQEYPDEPAVISVIAAVRNESEHIAALLESLAVQTVGSARLEVVLCDDHSDDDTVSIANRYQQRFRRLLVCQNAGSGNTDGLNTALRSAGGRYILLASGHCEFAADYVELLIGTLQEQDCEMAGGHTVARGQGGLARAIRTAMSTPFGVGLARFRYADEPGPAHTAAFALIRKEVFERLGEFDSAFVKNQDDEFSFRVLRSGMSIYYQPRAKVGYVVRNTLSAFVCQYWRYGFWKIGHLRRFGRLPALWQLVPLAFVLGLLLAPLILILLPEWCGLVLVPAVIYIVAGLWASYRALAPKQFGWWLLAPGIYFSMHFSYGAGLLSGLISLALGGKLRRIKTWRGENNGS